MAINNEILKRDWFKEGLSYQVDGFGEGSFFTDNFGSLLGTSNFSGIRDTRFTPALLNYMFTANPLAFGIYNKIQNIIEAKEFKFCGKNELKNQYYLELLEYINYKKLLKEGFMPAFWGTGGGNALCYVVKEKGKPKVYLDPFIMSGDTRIRVTGDGGVHNEPKKYEVLKLGTQEVLYTFEGETLKNVRHIKYSTPNGDSLIGTSPIISLVKMWALKSKALSATETVFGNGLQASHIISLEVDKMSDVRGGVKLPDIQTIGNKLAQEIMQGATGLRNKNTAIVSPVPISTTKIQSNNVEMETIKMIDFSNDETYICFNLDKGVFDKSKTKYNNADLADDSVWKAIEPKVGIFISLLESFVIPIYEPTYNEKSYPLRIEFDPTTQDFETAKLKQETKSIELGSIASLHKNGVPVRLTQQKIDEYLEDGLDFSSIFTDPVEATTNIIGNDFTKITEKEKFARASIEDLDEVYSKYHSLVNMSASELEAWSNNPCSKNASLDRSPIERNLNLLRKSKNEWTANDITSANRTISFISRMKGAEQGEPTKTDDGRTCPSKRDISLRNWAYNPTKSRAMVDPETGLDDFTKEIEALPKLQKAKKGLENKFLKLIQNATA
jgi:hypothetical protein